MNARSLAEENLREAVCIGDEDAVRSMLTNGVDINSQNRMNGWTALHWAVHRGHKRLVQVLLDLGASTEVKASDGKIPAQLAKDPNVKQLLGVDEMAGDDRQSDGTTFQPNYLRSPQLVFVDRQAPRTTSDWPKRSPAASSTTTSASSRNTETAVVAPTPVVQHTPPEQSALIVKARVAGRSEMDFVEVDVENLTFSGLLSACASELEVKLEDIVKIRKLPNVLVRKDRDVQRLTANAELEVCLSENWADVVVSIATLLFATWTKTWNVHWRWYSLREMRRVKGRCMPIRPTGLCSGAILRSVLHSCASACSTTWADTKHMRPLLSYLPCTAFGPFLSRKRRKVPVHLETCLQPVHGKQCMLLLLGHSHSSCWVAV